MTILDLSCEYRHGYLFSVEPCDEAMTVEDLVKGLNEGSYRLTANNDAVVDGSGTVVAVIASYEPDAGASQFTDWRS